MSRPIFSATCIIVVGGMLSACVPAPSQSGRAQFDAACAQCHGADARGDNGPDLTLLAARNGGTFPVLAVLNKIDGYAQGTARSGARMPAMGDLMTGRLVRFDTGAGVTRPVPEKIVELTAHLRSVQRAP